MFRALRRMFRAIWATLTGRVDETADGLSANPHAIRAEYTQILREKRENLQTAMDAVARLMSLEKQNERRLGQINEQVASKRRLMEGAGAMAKKRVAELKQKGADEAAIREDAEVQKCQAAFRDFKSSVEQLESEFTNLENQAKEYEASIQKQKVQLERLQRDIASIERESHEAVADIISAQQRKQLSDVLSKISTDASGERLQQLRDIRGRSVANAQISEQLAGTDTAAQEAEFLKYAQEHVADSEFDSLIGLGGQTVTQKDVEAQSEGLERKMLPED